MKKLKTVLSAYTWCFPSDTIPTQDLSPYRNVIGNFGLKQTILVLQHSYYYSYFKLYTWIVSFAALKRKINKVKLLYLKLCNLGSIGYLAHAKSFINLYKVQLHSENDTEIK
jgi:hypothetical protein